MFLAAALCLVAWPAAANDQALIDFVGYSDDFRYFAFEEYGVQDGSGFPYSNIYVLDLPADKWVSGSPFRARVDDEAAKQNDARAAAAELAQPTVDQLGITEPADLIAMNGDGEAGNGTDLAFGAPGYFPNDPQGSYKLTLEVFPAPAAEDCAGLGIDALGYALTLEADAETRELHRDKTLPKSRGCPQTYRIYGVAAPLNASAPSGYVAIIASYPFGFEGPDRRFIAVPLDK
jgi:predicted secreted protein